MRTRLRCIQWLATLLVLPALAHAQPAETPENPDDPRQIRQDQPSFLVRAELNHATRSYREGDALSLKVVCEIDAYLYVLYQQADGQVFQIYPNSQQADNRIQARQPVEVPAADDSFRWAIGPPFGTELIKVIASREPIDELSDPALRKGRFNPVGDAALKGVALELGAAPPVEWSESQIELTTYPRDTSLLAGGPKRYGVFFGVSQYEFNTQVERISKGKSKLNLPCCHRDARQLADIMREVGALSDVRVYTNEEATRQNLEQAVTDWLPSVSRPGDTVFVYFSGHGMQMPDDNDDETDKKEELLIPHDYLGIDALAALLEEAKAGTLDGRLVNRVQDAVNLVKQAGSLEKGADVLARRTAVSDDLFGH